MLCTMRFVLVVACIAALCAVQAQACRLAGDKCIDDGKGCATKRTGAGTCVYYETSPRLIESKIEEARVKFTKKVKKENSNLEGLADDSKAVKKAVKEMMEADESLYEPAHCTCVPVPAQPYAFDTQDDFHSFCNLMYAAYRAAGVCIAGKWLRKPSTKGGDPEPVSCTTEQIAKWAVQGSSVMGKQYNRKETDPDDPTKLIRAPFDGLRTMKDNERGKSDLDTAIESSALLAFVRDTLTVETRNPTRSDPLDEKNIAKWGRGKVQTDAFMNLGTAHYILSTTLGRQVNSMISSDDTTRGGKQPEIACPAPSDTAIASAYATLKRGYGRAMTIEDRKHGKKKEKEEFGFLVPL